MRIFGVDEPPPVLSLRATLALLLYYCGTWVLGGLGFWFIIRSVADPPFRSIPFLGGASAVGAIVAVLVVFAPSGLGVREASMYGLILAVAPQEAALGAVVLNRLVITAVEGAAARRRRSLARPRQRPPEVAAEARARAVGVSGERRSVRARPRASARGRARPPTRPCSRCRSRCPPRSRRSLERRGLATVGDLLETPPRTYRDYGAADDLGAAARTRATCATVRGVVESVRERPTSRRNLRDRDGAGRRRDAAA